VKISAAIKKNHPPAQLITLFQIRLMAANGNSSVRKRNQLLKRRMAEASPSSEGMVLRD
jgi:hypothetical protein